jgi:hypothetical protein
MKITLQNVDRLSLAEMQEFVQGSRRIEFAAQDRGATYELLERVCAACATASYQKASAEWCADYW